MVLIDCLLKCTWVFILNIAKSFKIFVGPIPYHSNIFNSSCTLKLFFKLLFSNLVGKSFNKKSFAPYRNCWSSLCFFLSSCWRNRYISVANFISIFSQCIFISFFIIKFNMCIPQTSVCVLIPGHFYVLNSISGDQELSQIVFSAFIWESTEKCLVNLLLLLVLIFLLLFTHQQYQKIQSIYICIQFYKYNYQASHIFNNLFEFHILSIFFLYNMRIQIKRQINMDLSLNFKFNNLNQNKQGSNRTQLMLKENYPLSQPSEAPSGGATLSAKQQQLFKFCNVPAFKVNQITSGVKLAKVVNQIFFDNCNNPLSNNINNKNEERKGNNIVNFNIILKQIKNNTKFPCPQNIRQLSPFTLIQIQQQMIKFVDWLVQCWVNSSKSVKANNEGKQNLSRNIVDNYSKFQAADNIIRNKKDVVSKKNALQVHQQIRQSNDYELIQNYNEGQDQNLFENVYFLDRDLSPQKENMQLNDSLQMSQKVSKKGSFKVFKPKTNFGDSSNNQENSDHKRMVEIDSPNTSKILNKIGTQNKGTGYENIQRYYSDQKQSPARKTIPKYPDRPPMYRKLNREQTKTQIQNKGQNLQQNIYDPSPFLIQNNSSGAKKIQESQVTKPLKQKNRNENLFNEISRIQEEIKKQGAQINKSKVKQSQSKPKNTATLPQSSDNKTKSGRKLFKLDIKPVNEGERKDIMAWLIGINLLNSMATNYFESFHQICKNGVIFPEIINHYKGRSGQISYFKNPGKSAEIHSNYQKVFSYLKQLPNFESQLLFMYDYFIPQALQNAFWSLLKSCQSCFQKVTYTKNKTYTQETSIKQRLRSKPQSQIQSRIKTERYQNNSQSLKKSNANDYEKIKYGSTSKFKSNQKKHKNQKAKQIQTQYEEPKSKRKGSFDFIKQLPQKVNKFKHQQLVQVQEPIQVSNKSKGYRELHQLKKSHNTSSFVNTPQKKTQTSLNRSRIVSTNSIKKVQQKPQIPSITLEMEMKAIKYLKQKKFFNFQSVEYLSLFQDPIRNGVLFNKIIIQELKLVYKFNQKPKNIIDCRQNFKLGLQQLKQSFALVPFAYEFYVEDIIKGQLTIFYGLVWHVLNFGLNKVFLNLGPNSLKNQSAILNISKNQNYFDNQSNEKILSEILFWIRELQQQNPAIAQLQIRDYNSLSNNILCHNLLYKIATLVVPEKYTLKPTYEQPVNQLQQQSNLKKILSFYTHNKILKSELAWKSKSVVKKQKSATIQIMKNLMNYSKGLKKSILQVEIENPVISFVKFVRPNQKSQLKGNQRGNQRLQTTMANNSFGAAPAKKQVSRKNSKKQAASQAHIQVPWMRSLGFTGDLSLNNGVILCRLISRLTMQTLNYNESPTSKAQCLSNIRKALKLIDKFKWDQEDIASADQKVTYQIYKFIKQKYKHSYALKEIN